MSSDMTSIEDIFKRPSLPGNKRKIEINRGADEVYKASKFSADADVKTNGHVTHNDEEEDLDDAAAGPDMPPDEDVQALDGEEDRFFGGGVTKDTAAALDFIDERDKDDTGSDKFDLSWLRKLALNFEKRISKNAELRAKYEETPQKFMSSEADLDADIKALSILSEHPELYAEFANLGCVTSLVSLLSHENADIAIDVLEIIHELIDEDIEAEQSQWDALVDALLKADLLGLLYENVSRLDEEVESDRAGVYHILGVLESLASRPALAATIGTDTKFFTWMLARIQKAEATVSQNKQYTAEILAILLQSSSSNRDRVIHMNGMEVFLQLISPYRRRDPSKGTEQEEFAENIFDCVTCCVDDTSGKAKYVEAEGVELCLIMLREGKMSKPRALRVLDHALGGPDSRSCCERLVEAAGLKTVFALFTKSTETKSTEHFLGILASLLRSLPANEAPRIRLLAKFVEKDYRSLHRLVQIRREVAPRIVNTDQAIDAEKKSYNPEEQAEQADEWLSRRLDAGLYVLQTVDVILAWLVAEDEGSRARTMELLADRDESLNNVKATLQEQLSGMEASTEEEDGVLKDMLNTLMLCL